MCQLSVLDFQHAGLVEPEPQATAVLRGCRGLWGIKNCGIDEAIILTGVDFDPGYGEVGVEIVSEWCMEAQDVVNLDFDIDEGAGAAAAISFGVIDRDFGVNFSAAERFAFVQDTLGLVGGVVQGEVFSFSFKFTAVITELVDGLVSPDFLESDEDSVFIGHGAVPDIIREIIGMGVDGEELEDGGGGKDD